MKGRQDMKRMTKPMKKDRFRRVWLMALFLSLGPLLALSQEVPIPDYKVGPGDLLDINVFGVEQLNTTVRVSESGKVTLHLLGEVEVSGLTKPELEKKLTLLLRKDLVDPQVTVFIKEYSSKVVYVQGAVTKPGIYPLLGRLSLRQIISQSGGFTPAAGNEIIVIRQVSGGGGSSLNISIDDLMIKGDPNVNIPLEPGDVINVPVDRTVVIYVLGQVKNPGAQEFKKSSMPTLLKAITKAGGFTDRAAKGSIHIKRKDAFGKDVEIIVNAKDILKGKKPDIALQPEDIIYIDETIF
jgi:polysaccharide export outer membrane protein